MKGKTISLFITFLVLVGAGVAYFHQHSLHLMSVAAGSMSVETKKHFWHLGIDCQEVYEVRLVGQAERAVLTENVYPCYL